jgi:hypothetical protein
MASIAHGRDILKGQWLQRMEFINQYLKPQDLIEAATAAGYHWRERVWRKQGVAPTHFTNRLWSACCGNSSRRTGLTYANGAAVNYSYDTASRLSYIDNQTGNGQHKYTYMGIVGSHLHISHFLPTLPTSGLRFRLRLTGPIGPESTALL